MQESPVVFVDPDEDDQYLLKSVLSQIAPERPVLFFNNGQAALDYLLTAEQAPYMIISETVMSGLNGLELRQQIENRPELRKKSIPFIFLTHPVVDAIVDQAYELTIQGFFEKKATQQQWHKQLQAVFTYWDECTCPNQFIKN